MEKIYDAIYVGGIRPQKNHNLTCLLNNTLFISDTNNKFDTNKSNKILINVNTHDIVNYINKAKCGLILSEHEGGCYSSTEYLLCGIPVVSCKNSKNWSTGGREIYYNDYNSIQCNHGYCLI